MSSMARLLKRWRDNYYLSLLLARAARPLHALSAKTALGIQRKVRKNGATIRLPNGKRLTIARDTGIGIASLLFWRGIDGYEPETSRTLRFFFERSTTFVDVGANCGLYSLLGALWNPNLQVIAFEPVPQTFAGLMKNVERNHLEARVHVENVALSSRSGTATLFLPTGESADVEATGTLEAESWQARQKSPQLTVQTTRFDDYERQHPMSLDLIKIDVEDFEADVLDGMRPVISRDKPFIICEILPRPHGNERTRALVESLGYHAYWITSAGYIRVPRFDFERNDYTDFLLAPVTTADAVLGNLDALWAARQARPGLIVR